MTIDQQFRSFYFRRFDFVFVVNTNGFYVSRIFHLHCFELSLEEIPLFSEERRSEVKTDFHFFVVTLEWGEFRLEFGFLLREWKAWREVRRGRWGSYFVECLRIGMILHRERITFEFGFFDLLDEILENERGWRIVRVSQRYRQTMRSFSSSMTCCWSWEREWCSVSKSSYNDELKRCHGDRSSHSLPLVSVWNRRCFDGWSLPEVIVEYSVCPCPSAIDVDERWTVDSQARREEMTRTERQTILHRSQCSSIERFHFLESFEHFESERSETSERRVSLIKQLVESLHHSRCVWSVLPGADGLSRETIVARGDRRGKRYEHGIRWVLFPIWSLDLVEQSSALWTSRDLSLIVRSVLTSVSNRIYVCRRLSPISSLWPSI